MEPREKHDVRRLQFYIFTLHHFHGIHSGKKFLDG